MSEQEFELYLKLLSRCLALTSRQREQIADELRDHLEERLEELAAAGISREKAVVQALDEFGDAAVLAAHFTTIAHLKRRRFLMRLSLGSVVGLAAALLVAYAFWPENHAVQIPAPVFAQNNPKKAEPAHTARKAAPHPKAAAAAPHLAERPLSSDVGHDPLVRRIQEALEQTTEFTIDPQPLKEALDFIAQRYQIPLLLDHKNLEDASIDTSSEVKLPYSGLKLRQTLTLLLEQLAQPMAFDIHEGVLLISTRERIQARRFVVVYDCRDLVNLRPIMPVEGVHRQTSSAQRNDGGGMGGGMFDVPPPAAGKGKEPAVNASQKPPEKSAEPAATNCEEPVSPLIRVIKYAGDEDAWSGEGAGQITELGGLLVVNQSAIVHEEIKRILSDLRRVRKDGAFASFEPDHTAPPSRAVSP